MGKKPLPVSASQFAMRRVVPSLLRMIGPHSSKRIDSPNRMEGRSESGSGGGSWGIVSPLLLLLLWFDEDDDRASTFSVDVAMVMAKRKRMAALVRNNVHSRRILEYMFFSVAPPGGKVSGMMARQRLWFSHLVPPQIVL